MNIGIKLAFASGTKYIALDTVTINSIQHPGYVKSISPFVYSMSEEGEYEISEIRIVIDNVNGNWDQYKTSSSYGVEVTLLEIDNTTITTKFIEEYGGDDTELILVVSDHYSEINKPIPAEIITMEEFPAAVAGAHGEPIPYYFGHFVKPVHNDYYGENMVKAWRVDLDGTHEYLIGFAGATTITALDRVHDSSGADISGVCALTTSGSKYYINYTGGGGPWDYVLVNFTYNADVAACDLIAEVGASLFSDYSFSIANINTILATRRYDRGLVDYLQSHIGIVKNEPGKNHLRDICQNFNLEYYIDSGKNIVFTILNYDSLTASNTFKEVEILSFKYEKEDTESLKNKIIGHSGHYFPDGGYHAEAECIKQQSIDDNSVTITKDLYTKFLHNGKFAQPCAGSYLHYITPKFYAIEHKNAERRAIIEMDVNKIIDLVPSNYIEFPHSDAVDDTTRLYQIKKIKFDYMNDLAILEIKDITDLKDVRTADKFVLQPNSIQASTIFYDDSPIFTHGMANANVYHTTATKKFGTSSANFPGANNVLRIGTGQAETAWNIFAQTNVTIELWIAFDGLGSVEYVITQFEDANNRWYVYKDAADKMVFGLHSGGVQVVVTTSDTAVPDVNFHHWVLVKKGIEYAWYLAGSQDSYLSDASVDTLSGAQVFIGQDHNQANDLDAQIALIRLAHDDPFSTTPVVGKVDTLTVPTRMLRDNGF